MLVAIDTTEGAIVATDVAIGALTPRLGMLPAVDGEEICVRVECRGRPRCLAVAIRAVG